MKKIKVVIGANFGDEGKGLMTDYFCNSFPSNEKVLNVRYNGTCQAGHTVVKGDRRHVFSHFGAGSFNENVDTYLSSFFYCNPILFNSEYGELVEKGVLPKVRVAYNSPLVTIYDMLYNRILETSRGVARHGSCGLGLWESVQRRTQGLELKIKDLFIGRDYIHAKLREIRDSYSTKVEKRKVSIPEMGMWEDENVLYAYTEECMQMLNRIVCVEEHQVLLEYDNLVFEGAQGLLLDWDNRAYMPYLTASYTGVKNVCSLLDIVHQRGKKPLDIEVCYMTRSYMTRHGAGMFLTEVKDKRELGIVHTDKTNIYNPWQENLRYGYLEIDDLLARLEKDLEGISKYEVKKAICITHLDVTQGVIKTPSKGVKVDELRDVLPEWGIYTSHSEESKSIENLSWKEV